MVLDRLKDNKTRINNLGNKAPDTPITVGILKPSRFKFKKPKNISKRQKIILVVVIFVGVALILFSYKYKSKKSQPINNFKKDDLAQLQAITPNESSDAFTKAAYYILLGDKLVAANKPDEAVKSYLQAEKFSSSSTLSYKIAKLYQQIGDNSGFNTYANKYLKTVDKQNLSNAFTIAELAEAIGEKELAKEFYIKALANYEKADPKFITDETKEFIQQIKDKISEFERG